MEPNQIVVSQPPKRFFVYCGLALLLIVAGILTWNYFANRKLVTVHPTEGNTITIGTSTDGENGPGIKDVLLKTSSNSSIHLNKGSYTVEYSNGSDYSPVFEVLKVQGDTYVTGQKLSYSPVKMGQLLSEQQAAIRSALGSATSLAGYTVTKETLYQNGDWYTAKLVPADSNKDVVGVVMHKSQGAWKLVAGPGITLFIGDFPNIPADVIRSVNNQQV